MYKLLNKRDFQSIIPGQNFNHEVMPTYLYKEWRSNDEFSEINKSDIFIFAIVRNPLSRFLSSYKNRVLIADDIGVDNLASKKCVKAGLPIKPDINTFVQNLSFYQENCPSILHHTLPQVSFLGHNPNFYSKIYPINKVDSELWEDLSKIVGEEIATPQKENQGAGSWLVIDQLTSENLAKIQDLYSADYDFLDGIIT